MKLSDLLRAGRRPRGEPRPEGSAPEDDAAARDSRARVGLLVLAAGFAVLLIGLFREQVMNEGPHALSERGHRLRAVPLPAPRGRLLDREGRVLAESVPGYAVVLLPAPRDTLRTTVARLQEILALPDAERTRLTREIQGPPRPIVVATDVAFDRVAAIEERRYALPRVLVEFWPIRRYPAGAAAWAVTGRVAPVERSDPSGRDAGTVAGVSGLERAFDSVLRGESGLRYVEVDRDGRIVAGAAGAPASAPVAGESVRTTIDLDLQRFVAGELPEEGGGAAAIVLDAATGGILALHSTPVPDRRRPDTTAVDRAVAAPFVPEALFQPIMAALALEAGAIEPDRPMTVPCRGGMQYGNRYFRCWNPAGHGSRTLAGALEGGCDVYFYQVGLRLGLTRLLELGRRARLAEPTGIELPSERAGRFPADAAAIEERTGWEPGAADALELAGGRDGMALTLVRLAHAYAVLTREGGSPAPRLVRSGAEAEWQPQLEPTGRAALLAGLRRAGAAATGSASTVAGEWARWRPDRADRVRPSAFVGAFAPAGGGDAIVVGVVVDEARSDREAARQATRIADYYLRRDQPTPARTP